MVKPSLHFAHIDNLSIKSTPTSVLEKEKKSVDSPAPLFFSMWIKNNLYHNIFVCNIIHKTLEEAVFETESNSFSKWKCGK